MKQTDEIREIVSLETEKPNTESSSKPLFQRYQIKIKTGVRAGAAPIGEWPFR